MISAEQEGECGAASECGVPATAKQEAPSETQPIASPAAASTSTTHAEGGI